MNLTQELATLRTSQHAMEDDYRLFPDGSIREGTITRSGEVGWKILAKPIPAASPQILMHFPEGHLSVDDLRRALDLRDLIMTKVVEASTVKSMENVVRKQIKAEQKKERPKRPKTERVLKPRVKIAAPPPGWGSV